jgi:hypothetical protein
MVVTNQNYIQEEIKKNEFGEMLLPISPLSQQSTAEVNKTKTSAEF